MTYVTYRTPSTPEWTYEGLLEAIQKHSELGIGEIKDAGQYGADGGFGGFIYTTECVQFYDANERMIEAFATEQAEQFGHSNAMEMATTFGRSDMLDSGVDGYKNLMAWFVLEEVGRWLEDNEPEFESDDGYTEADFDTDLPIGAIG